MQKPKFYLIKIEVFFIYIQFSVQFSRVAFQRNEVGSQVREQLIMKKIRHKKQYLSVIFDEVIYFLFFQWEKKWLVTYKDIIWQQML